MNYRELLALAREHGASDPSHVAAIGIVAVSKGDDPHDVLEQIARSQPALFRPKKGKRK